MPEKSVQTSNRIKIIVLVALGVAAVMIVAVMYFVWQSLLNNQSDRLSSESATTGLLEPIDVSVNPLVTKAEQEISGQPVIRESDPKKGASDPEVTIVEFGSFGSGYSASAERVLTQVIDTYGDRVNLVWKDYYNQSDDLALLGAEAARCAGNQGKYWEMHSKIFHSENGFTFEELLQYASDLALDSELFQSCLDSDATVGLIDLSVSDAISLNLPGVPVFFIGETLQEGVVTYDEFAALVEAELAK
ncbi:MAG: thioredoxin domain-containing protein [bacterium]|nr:thioredoxin domain-containing protein [bacterium]